MRVRIRLKGCDDETRVTTHLTLDQYVFLIRIQEKLNARSDYECKPKMYVSLVDKSKKDSSYLKKIEEKKAGEELNEDAKH